MGLGYCFQLPHFLKIYCFHFKRENDSRHIKAYTFTISLPPPPLRRGQNWKEPSVVTVFNLKPLCLAPTRTRLSPPPGRWYHTPQGHLWPPYCWIQTSLLRHCQCGHDWLLPPPGFRHCSVSLPSPSLFLGLQASLSLTLLCWSAQGSVGEFLLSPSLRISLQARDYK